MAKKLSRLRAHKLAVKAEAQRAKKHDRKAARYVSRDVEGESTSRRAVSARVRTMKRTASRTDREHATPAVDDATTGVLVKRLLGDMALDAEDKALSSVRMAADAGDRADKQNKKNKKKEKRTRSDEPTAAAAEKKRAKKVPRPESSFAIPLEGDGNEEDEDMSREVALAASQFFAKLKPTQQKSFWSLRSVAQGTASAVESKASSSSASTAAAAQKKAKKSKAGQAILDGADDDLSFGYLMNAAHDKQKNKSKSDRGEGEDEEEQDADDASVSSSHSNSSSEPSWIPESDDEFSTDEENDDEDEEEEEEEEEVEEAPKKSVASKKSSSKASEHVTVNSHRGHGGRLFGLQEEDDTWDD